MSANNIEPCIQALDSLCARVALVRTPHVPRIDGVAEPPEGTAFWSSSYAQLLLWPTASNAAQSIAMAADQGEGWLDAALSQAEKASAIPLDGYLVLALPSAPELATSDEVRRVELSARLCRKHLVWPSSAEALAAGSEPWARVADITVVGLPDAVTAGGDTLYWPEIGPLAAALWRELQEKGPPATALADAEAPIPMGSAT